MLSKKAQAERQPPDRKAPKVISPSDPASATHNCPELRAFVATQHRMV
jgi:hypothetical protein